MWYKRLLYFYPKSYRKQFGEGMEQTFSDLYYEHQNAQKGIPWFIVWIFSETLTSIIKENLTSFIMNSKHLIRVALITGVLLLIPFFAMQFTDEVHWDLFDFIIAGTLLFGSGLTYKLISRKANSFTYKAAVGLAVFTGLFLIWSNLAVGIIGDGNNPANLMYIGVLGIGILGSFMNRFDPQGMAKTLFATASAQMLVAVIVLVMRLDIPGMTLVINGFFTVLWITSALLFQKASLTNQKKFTA